MERAEGWPRTGQRRPRQRRARRPAARRAELAAGVSPQPDRAALAISSRCRLEGTTSNRDAVGARVTVTSGGGRQTAWRIGGGSYASAERPASPFRSRLGGGWSTRSRSAGHRAGWTSFATLPADTGYLIREAESKPALLNGFATRLLSQDGEQSVSRGVNELCWDEIESITKARKYEDTKMATIVLPCRLLSRDGEQSVSRGMHYPRRLQYRLVPGELSTGGAIPKKRRLPLASDSQDKVESRFLISSCFRTFVFS